MPFSNTDITFSVAFTVADDFKSGTCVYTGTTAYFTTFGITLSNVTETISFFSPGNLSVPFATSVINCGTTRTASVNLPRGTDGKVIQGEYMLTVTSVVIGGVDPGTYVTPDSPALYHEFCPGTLSLVITPDVSCLCGILTVDDDTDYTGLGWTVSSRTFVLNAPILSGSSPAYFDTSTGDSVSTTGNPLYNKKTYTWNITVTATSGTTTLTLTKSGSVDVDCSSFCKMKCALDTATGMVGNNSQLFNSLWMAHLQFTLAYNNQSCDYASSQAAMDSFWNYMKPFGITADGDCCDCCDGDLEVVTPICGGSGSGDLTSVNNASETWFTLTYVGGVLTAGLTAQGIAYMNGISTYSVVSSDESVTVTPTTVAGSATTPPSTEYDLSITQIAQMKFYYTEVYNQTSGLTTATISELTRVGRDVWARSAINPHNYINPVISNVVLSAYSLMGISGLFSDAVGVATTENFIAYAQIVNARPLKAFQAPQVWTNRILECDVTNLPTTGASNGFYVRMWDKRGWNPLYGLTPFSYSLLINTFETITWQITIELI